MSQMRALSDEEYAHKKEDEQAQDLIHTVLLQKVCNLICQQNHCETRDQNRYDHERDLIGGSACRNIFYRRNRHRRKNRVDREDQVHQNNKRNRAHNCSRPTAFRMLNMVNL